MKHQIRGCAAVIVLMALLLVITPARAWADENGDRAYDLVRQAIALIVNTPADVDAISDKIDAALSAKDQSQVQIPLVQQAKDALARGNLHRVRALLEKSIGARGSGRIAAVEAMPGRGSLSGGDWVMLGLSVLVGVVGIVAAAVLRPRHLPRPGPTPRGDPVMSRTAETEPVPTGPEPTRRGVFGRAVDAVDERLGIRALEYPVPAHANTLGYSLGGLTAVALVILIVTGIVLAQFYHPGPGGANESVRHIVTNVYLGRWVRGVHFWAAEAMYVLAILHLLRVYFTGSYKRPREANWLIGVAMFALIMGALFTGTVLRWDQEGFEVLGRNLELARLLGGLGFWFTGGFSSASPLLVRLYVAHVSVLPALILILLVLHALLVKYHKISPRPDNPTETGEPFEPFTHHLRRIGALGLVLLGGLGVLAVLFPPGVGPTPVEGIEVTRPPWMYWWMFSLQNWVGRSGILWGGIILFALLIALPFVDRNPRRYWRQRPLAIGIGALVLAAIIILTVLGAITTPAQHLG